MTANITHSELRLKSRQMGESQRLAKLVSISEQRKAISQTKLSVGLSSTRMPPGRKGDGRINPISEKRKLWMREYSRLRKWFLVENPWCPVSRVIFLETARTHEVHHLRGRAGKLLLNTKFWLAVSRKGHQWINDNPAKARARGFLCALGEWGKQE